MSSNAMDGLREFIERRSSAGTTSRSVSPTLDEVVLVLSRKGTVEAVLQAPDNDESRSELLGQCISSIWPESAARQIRDEIKKTLRSRKVRTDDICIPNDRSLFECICIPQGRDRVLMILRDVTTRRQNGAGSHGDTTMSLPTRDYLFGELQHITATQRLKEGRAALICINIGHIDDAGHVFGPGQQDDILKSLGERLKLELRGANSQKQFDFERLSVVTRFDFRQFAIVLPSIGAGADAASVTERMLALLREPVSCGGRDIKVDPRAGISMFPQDGDDPETLFSNAYVAMELANASDEDDYCFHSGTISLHNLHRQDLEYGLKSGLDRDEFTLNFLPIVNTRTHEVFSVEALLRWPDQALGSRSVRQVVSVAERTGLILPIGEWVLKKSCRQIQALHDTGNKDLRLSINVSAQEFSRAEFAPQLATILEELAFDPAFLDLEIQELVLFRDAIKGFAGCRELKAVGVGIVVDDYGTGACSLTHLAQSPVDGIKIDNSFVANLETNERDRATCAAAIAVAQNLGIKSIAEGVETRGQASYLASQGCDLLQGFFLSQPLAAKELIELMSLSKTGKIQRVWAHD